MDVVYICREGPNEELRYSLRSLVNLEHDRVWVFGGAPAWYTGALVPVPQIHGKQGNAKRALLAACEHPEVSDPFILMNDDFFVTAPAQIALYDRGPILDVLVEYRGRHPKSTYTAAIGRTLDMLRDMGHVDPLSYELHVPMPVGKALMRDVLKTLLTADVGLQHRSIYGALAGLPSTTIADVKIERSGQPLPRGPWLSTRDGTLGCVLHYLEALYPDMCRYESEGPIKRRKAVEQIKMRKGRATSRVPLDRVDKWRRLGWVIDGAIQSEVQLEAAPVPAPQKAVSDMKKAELVAYAEEHGIEIDAKANVAVIREVIELAEAPVPDAEPQSGTE